MSTVREQFIDYIQQLQNQICSGLESLDGAAHFKEDQWQREEGGGGKTRVISGGNLFEKGGVNISLVHGPLKDIVKKQLQVTEDEFFACGLSLVIHPQSPMVPTIHANVRYFETYNQNKEVANSWFGGGIDLTPYYLFEEDAVHFHKQLKSACDAHGEDLYPQYKVTCDQYFYNHHRNEMRGVGGIFFDYLKPNETHTAMDWLAFVQSVGDVFLPTYTEIVHRRKDLSWTEDHKKWQEIRRGRYVEFNLLHDRGTLFGIRTKGRTESILMSLPPTVRWEYDHQPVTNSREAHLVQHLQPIDWINYQ